MSRKIPAKLDHREILIYLLAEIDGWFCSVCGKEISSYEEASVDHVVPRSFGGQNRIDNVRLAHRRCQGRAYSEYKKRNGLLRPKVELSAEHNRGPQGIQIKSVGSLSTSPHFERWRETRRDLKRRLRDALSVRLNHQIS